MNGQIGTEIYQGQLFYLQPIDNKMVEINFPAQAAEADDTPYETKIPHQINFLEAVRNRKDPVVPVEVGHRTCTVCTLGNIACELKRTIKWNPASETFVDDTDGAAAAMMHYQYRNGWSLL